MNIEQKIWEYLLKNAMGMDHAIKMADLASAMGYAPYGSNNDNFRPIITKMIKEYCKPIGTCESGVFIITNKEELQIAIEYVTRGTKAEAIKKNGIYQP